MDHTVGLTKEFHYFKIPIVRRVEPNQTMSYTVPDTLSRPL